MILIESLVLFVDLSKHVLTLFQPWHKTCCSCKGCKKRIDATNMARHDMEIYCKGWCFELTDT